MKEEGWGEQEQWGPRRPGWQTDVIISKKGKPLLSFKWFKFLKVHFSYCGWWTAVGEETRIKMVWLARRPLQRSRPVGESVDLCSGSEADGIRIVWDLHKGVQCLLQVILQCPPFPLAQSFHFLTLFIITLHPVLCSIYQNPLWDSELPVQKSITDGRGNPFLHKDSVLFCFPSMVHYNLLLGKFGFVAKRRSCWMGSCEWGRTWLAL